MRSSARGPVRPPSTAGLDPERRAALRAVCARLGEAGHRSWLVGGAVRDLALGEVPKDLDLASAARPEEVEAAFPKTLAVGRAFGTVLILAEGLEFQHTTFRTEGSYSDGRRPDEVTYGTALVADAERRDFTCNALYLDPLTDELRDPEGGLEDLGAGRLRCVGDPDERFSEDGLRLVRLARFAARLGSEVDAATLAAARRQAPVLERVSAERCLAELERIFAGPRCWGALRLLVDCGLLERFLPAADWATPADGTAAAGRLTWLETLAKENPGGTSGGGPGLALGLAVLLAPPGLASPGLAPVDAAEAFERAVRGLEALKVSRELRRAVPEIWRLAFELEALLGGGVLGRAERVRAVRAGGYAEAQALLRARGGPVPGRAALDELDAFARGLTPEQRHPAPLVGPEDFAAAGVPRGPRFGRLLAEQEQLQLEGRLGDRAEALRWLERRAAELDAEG